MIHRICETLRQSTEEPRDLLLKHTTCYLNSFLLSTVCLKCEHSTYQNIQTTTRNRTIILHYFQHHSNHNSTTTTTHTITTPATPPAVWRPPQPGTPEAPSWGSRGSRKSHGTPPPAPCFPGLPSRSSVPPRTTPWRLHQSRNDAFFDYNALWTGKYTKIYNLE